MATKAQVGSIDAMEAFHGAYCQFEEDAKAALSSVDMEVRRSLSWLKQDRLPYWQGEERRWRQKLAEARTQLSRKRISTPHGPPKDSFEKELVREAEARLKEAEEKLIKIKKWIPLLERGVEEYHGQSRPLADLFAHCIPLGIGKLQAMIKSLAEYIAVAAPRLPGEMRAPRSSSASASAASGFNTSVETTEGDAIAGESERPGDVERDVLNSNPERDSSFSGDVADAGGEPERGRESS